MTMIVWENSFGLFLLYLRFLEPNGSSNLVKEPGY